MGFVMTTKKDTNEACDWVTQLQQLRQQIAERGGVLSGVTKEEIVSQLRQTRQELFEAEYAHHYRWPDKDFDINTQPPEDQQS
jgi:hypothetical protein